MLFSVELGTSEYLWRITSQLTKIVIHGKPSINLSFSRNLMLSWFCQFLLHAQIGTELLNFTLNIDFPSLDIHSVSCKTDYTSGVHKRFLERSDLVQQHSMLPFLLADSMVGKTDDTTAATLHYCSSETRVGDVATILYSDVCIDSISHTYKTSAKFLISIWFQNTKSWYVSLRLVHSRSAINMFIFSNALILDTPLLPY